MSNRSASETRSDLVGRMFAKLTAELEYAHELSVEGQNPRGTPTQRQKVFRRLERRLDRCRGVMAEISDLLRF